MVSSSETPPCTTTTKRTGRAEPVGVIIRPPPPPPPGSPRFLCDEEKKGRRGEKREPTGERTEQRSGEEEKKEAFDRAVWRPRVNGPVKGSHCLTATSIWYCTLLFLEHCLQPQCLLSPPLPLSLKEIGGLGPTVRGGGEGKSARAGGGQASLLLPLLRAQIGNDRDSSPPPPWQEGRDAFTLELLAPVVIVVAVDVAAPPSTSPTPLLLLSSQKLLPGVAATGYEKTPQ